MHKVQEDKEYIILACNNKQGYIVYNRHKIWEEGHTHIRTLKQAKDLIVCAKHHKIPRNVNKYFLVSLSRISNDNEFTELINYALDTTPNKKDRYRNTPRR